MWLFRGPAYVSSQRKGKRFKSTSMKSHNKGGLDALGCIPIKARSGADGAVSEGLQGPPRGDAFAYA